MHTDSISQYERAKIEHSLNCHLHENYYIALANRMDGKEDIYTQSMNVSRLFISVLTIFTHGKRKADRPFHQTYLVERPVCFYRFQGFQKLYLFLCKCNDRTCLSFQCLNCFIQGTDDCLFAWIETDKVHRSLNLWKHAPWRKLAFLDIPACFFQCQ